MNYLIVSLCMLIASTLSVTLQSLPDDLIKEITGFLDFKSAKNLQTKMKGVNALEMHSSTADQEALNSILKIHDTKTASYQLKILLDGNKNLDQNGLLDYLCYLHDKIPNRIALLLKLIYLLHHF
jgi:hypothetical protein